MTTTAAPAPTVEEPRYGNWRKRSLAGIGKLSAGPVLILGVELIFVLVVMGRFGLWGSTLGFLGMGVTLWLLWFKDKHDLTILDRAKERIMHWFDKIMGRTTYRAGVTGVIPGGTTQLPGLLSATEITEHLDAYERPFGVVRYPRTRHYVAVLELNPDGGGLHDSRTFNQFVADWGGFGAQFCRETGIVQFAVTNETAPDWGGRTVRFTEGVIDPRAPKFAQDSARQSASRRLSGAAASRTYMSITFKPSRVSDDKDTERRHIVEEIARRLPSIISRLSSTGAGSAVPMDAQAITEAVKSAYDPAIAQLIEEAHLEGEPAHIDWANAGPSAYDAEWDHLVHDSGVSMTWQMTRAPRGTVQARSLTRLLAPHPAIDRKRVTIIYRPIDEGEAVEQVEFDNRQAQIAYNNGRGSAEQISNYEKTLQTRREVEDGAGLMTFSMIVTATVTDPARAAEAVAAVEHSLTPSTRVLVRPLYGGQATGFAAGLPLGLAVDEHAKLKIKK